MCSSIISIQIGRSREFSGDDGKVWHSAIAKDPVDGAINVLPTGLAGDEQVDLVNHGGTDKAILAYSSAHFEKWRNEFPEFAEAGGMSGAFGENLTVGDRTEEDVCIGDVYTVGLAKLQVSQPRQPCWKLSKRWKLPTLAARVQQTGWTGWYLRVLETGSICAGDFLKLEERPYADWPVIRAHQVMFARPRDHTADLALATCPALSRSWQDQLQRRALKNS